MKENLSLLRNEIDSLKRLLENMSLSSIPLITDNEIAKGIHTMGSLYFIKNWGIFAKLY